MLLPFARKTAESNLGEAGFDFPTTPGSCHGAWLGGGEGLEAAFHLHSLIPSSQKPWEVGRRYYCFTTDEMEAEGMT